MKSALVCGAGGFIGSHLVTYLKNQGYYVRGADLKLPEYTKTDADEFIICDLRREESCLEVTSGMNHVYSLAANMGGMGFIQKYQSAILHDNMLIDVHMLEAAKTSCVERFFYSSSACIYPEYLQMVEGSIQLKEDSAYPAQPQDTYGWEKLLSEIMCEWCYKDHGLQTRVARFHNIYGPRGTWYGERTKVPAAMCQKIAYAKLTQSPTIEIWGDGKQERSFCYIDDCVEGIYKLTTSDYPKPLNIGQDEVVTINALADIIMDIAQYHVTKVHVRGNQGVRSRNSDNTRIQEVLHWQPSINLVKGLRKTYEWIEDQVAATL